MISTRQQIESSLGELTVSQLRSVAEFLEFLKFRKDRDAGSQFEDAELEALYSEFADEDRELAEAGFAEYSANLELEDAAK